MRAPLLPALAVLLAIAGCKREPVSPDDGASGPTDVLQDKTTVVDVPQGEPLSRADLDRVVIGKLEEKNDFHWEWVDLRTLWSATLYNDHSVAIGYKPAELGDVSDILAQVNVRSGKWRAVHDALITLILDGLNSDGHARVELKDILVEDDPVLPILTVHLTDKTVLTRLYNLRNVRYIEPLDYRPQAEEEQRSSSGCSPSTYALNAADYSTLAPNALLPWNYTLHNIPTAWNAAQGQGITIGLIDGGISSSQPLLGSNFNNGYSNVGRTITTAFTYGSSAYTSCSHGNSMSGLAAGPRNDQGATSGVAYKSNLAFVRGTSDVLLDESAERTGVKNALIQLGDNTNVRVISMSIGWILNSGVLEDGVNYAYGKGKMLMAAAGTSFSWTSWWGVVYPAALTKCVAVTGVKENGSTCETCHDGPQVDFTIIMERNNNSSRNSLSLPMSGVTPSYIGGSSAATSTAAGIAALVWSAKPTATREQILQCLVSTAQYYPTPNGNKGYGNINAQAAVNAAAAL